MSSLIAEHVEGRSLLFVLVIANDIDDGCGLFNFNTIITLITTALAERPKSGPTTQIPPL